MGLLDSIKSLLNKPAAIGEGDTIEVPASRIVPDSGIKSIRFVASAPGGALIVKDRHSTQTISTVGGALRDELTDEHIYISRGTEDCCLDGSLANLQRDTPWLTRQVALDICDFTLDFYVNPGVTTRQQATDKLIALCVRAGLIPPLPTV